MFHDKKTNVKSARREAQCPAGAALAVCVFYKIQTCLVRLARHL